MPRSDFEFSLPVRVRWAESDPQGVVFHGNFLTYFDAAQTEYLRHIGLPYPGGLREIGADLVVVKAGLECLAPVHFDDMIEVMTRVSRVGRTSLTFAFEIYRRGEDRLLVRGENVYVCISMEDSSPVPVPSGLLELLEGIDGPANKHA